MEPSLNIMDYRAEQVLDNVIDKFVDGCSLGRQHHYLHLVHLQHRWQGPHTLTDV